MISYNIIVPDEDRRWSFEFKDWSEDQVEQELSALQTAVDAAYSAPAVVNNETVLLSPPSGTSEPRLFASPLLLVEYGEGRKHLSPVEYGGGRKHLSLVEYGGGRKHPSLVEYGGGRKHHPFLARHPALFCHPALFS